MATRLTSQDVTVFSIGGGDQLANLRNCTVELSHDTQEGSPITRMGMNAQPVKRQVRIAANLLSTVTGTTRVSGLNLTSATLAAVNQLANIRSLNFSGSYTMANEEAVADQWAENRPIKKDYSAEVEYLIPQASGADLGDLAYAALPAEVALSFTLNGATITVPMVAVNHAVEATEGDVLVARLSLQGRAPFSGAYPTAPTGTASLLEWAFNAPATKRTIIVTTQAANGYSYEGSYVFSSFSFGIRSGELVENAYEFLSSGAVTRTSTS